jgi:PIN domain nuclease of toxin-antitoxin system
MGGVAVIVLDTHILVWWVNGSDQLSPKAKAAIHTEQQNPQGEVVIPSIVAWEIAMLQQRGKLTLSMDIDQWLALIEAIQGVRFLPLTPAVAVQSTRLPGEFHKDPADRFIVAQAIALNAPLVSADQKIIDYPHVRTIW